MSRSSTAATTNSTEKDARELYGKEVTVKITGNKAGDVTSDEGDTVQAEGFRVELVSDDPEVQAYFENSTIVFHITGSYSYQPKYTGYLDFSDAEPLDYTVKGTLGAYLTNKEITFSADDVDKEY